ncbi:flagellar filament capping protein FliD [Pseudoxanthomonas sp.]|uniref:flagellar filament capping protein FliD n=1 Tax=Pseudoxanthomonas sp. TaxID=1871049 RepID=UPI002620F5E2|nr:flagellar filament capping protein FliD [Pseudoxanthomonas sp.]WDS36844.1 MAG: flagellar filament capping protein FliD [Pseudoxanthomonas sp.]
MSSVYTGTISFSGLSSGVDTETLVTKLVAAERAGADTRISKATSSANGKISALGKVSSALSAVQTALEGLDSGKSGNARTATVAEGAGFTAVAASGASVGSYDIEVSQLATKHKLTSAAYAADAAVGAGTLTITAGDHSYDVTINADYTLANIAAAINAKTSGQGAVASVVRTDDGDRLVLTAADTGQANAIQVSSSDAALAALTYPGVTASDGSSVGLSQTTAAQDALIKVDGYTKTSASNTLTDVLDGVTLTLTKTTEGSAYNLAVETDQSAVSTAVSSYVSAYNAALTILGTVSAFDVEAQTQAALTGDSLVRNLESQLRSLVGSNYAALTQLGITTDKTGAMTLDAGKLSEALDANPSAVSNVFGADADFGKDMKTLMQNMLTSNTGVIPQRTLSLDNKIKDLADQTTDLNARMQKVEARYKAKFTAMEATMAKMSTTSSYLTQMIDSLGMSSGSSSSSKKSS